MSGLSDELKIGALIRERDALRGECDELRAALVDIWRKKDTIDREDAILAWIYARARAVLSRRPQETE